MLFGALVQRSVMSTEHFVSTISLHVCLLSGGPRVGRAESSLKCVTIVGAGKWLPCLAANKTP